MSFVGKAISGIGQALGLVPTPPPMPVIMPVPTSNNADTSAAMDAAAQNAAAGVQRGRTSTLLTGGAGALTDPTNTSKVLLGQ